MVVIIMGFEGQGEEGLRFKDKRAAGFGKGQRQSGRQRTGSLVNKNGCQANLLETRLRESRSLHLRTALQRL